MLSRLTHANPRDMDAVVAVPPAPLQSAFAARVATPERLKAAHQASSARLDALFASLQYRAFRGEL